ncbi:hypothetical protein [Flavobacterium sp. NKUCC04_CG]|uniref:hypothetical protein n=1 Tax=Flavobacterium sp. NKUCC04_CG TaxID=2842121 RepID=UPI001C5BA9B3|nr:hypothetical protein [Flavobacterium sp. NKUCC04_CG]MBW3520083.1 hypothetical protein [Flavobacterium sp. NKUCC04_CG]
MKTLSQLIRLYKLKILALFMVFFLFSCQKQFDKQNRIQSIIKDSLKIEKEYSSIIVLGPGGCLNCDKNLYSLILNNLDNEEVLFVVSATGSAFDVEELESKESPNLVFDYKNYFDKTNLFLMASGAIFFKGNPPVLDTIIQMSSRDISNRIGYIAKRINTTE